MSRTVYVLEYSHEHGTDVFTYATELLAQRARAAICVDWSSEMLDGVDLSTVSEVRRALPAKTQVLFDAGKYDECVDVYIEEFPSESLDIYPCVLQLGEPVSGTVVDVKTNLVHQVLEHAYGAENGMTACQRPFYWSGFVKRRGKDTIFACMPKEARPATCLGCIGAPRVT